jgi:uncharacterized membrane protein YhdT
MAKSHKPAKSVTRGLLAGRDLRGPAIAALAILLLCDLVVKHYRYFAIDGTFGFAAWFGALSCFALILLALAIGSLLRRPEATYDD